MEGKVSKILWGVPGADPIAEMSVRSFFGNIFCWEGQGDNWRKFFLELIFKPFSIFQQAKMIYLLFGPLTPNLSMFSCLYVQFCKCCVANLWIHCNSSTAQIHWTAGMIPCPWMGDTQSSLSQFQGLSEALRLMHSSPEKFSKDSLISALWELTGQSDSSPLQNRLVSTAAKWSYSVRCSREVVCWERSHPHVTMRKGFRDGRLGEYGRERTRE